MRKSIWIIFVLAYCFSFSQKQNIPLREEFDVNSFDNYISGLSAKNRGEVDKAIQRFENISRNDSLYEKALTELAEIHFSQRNDSEVVELCLNGISIDGENDFIFRDYLLESLLNLKDEEFFTHLVTAKKRYPYSEELLVMEARGLIRFQHYDEGIKILQNVIRRNPFNKSAHYYLGRHMADRGDFIRAVFSLETFLLFSNNNSLRTDTALNVLNQIAQHEYEIKIKGISRNNLFQELEELVESGIALGTKYPSASPLKYSISRQTDLLLKNVQYKSEGADFWMEFYVSFLIAVRERNFIRAHTYQFLSYLGNAEVEKGKIKYADEIKAYVDFTVDYFSSLREQSIIVVEGQEFTKTKFYDEDDFLQSVGKMEGDIPQGKWYYFYPTGALKSVVNFDQQGKFTDSSKVYYENGKLLSICTSKNGLVNGTFTTFYPTGVVKSEWNYVNDTLEGIQKDYYPTGALKINSIYKSGKANGKAFNYNSKGVLVSEINYKNDELDGDEIYYYQGKRPSTILKNTEGKANGIFTSFYENGKVSKSGMLENGKGLGKWEEYFNNGKISSVYHYNNKGEYIDSTLTFHPNGNVESKTFYKKGKRVGSQYIYASKGWLLAEFIYKNDALIKYTYFTEKGKELDKGSNHVKNYNEYGMLVSEGSFVGSKREGKWVFYYKEGVKQASCLYNINGELEGVYEAYFKSGALESRSYYSYDLLDGMYTEFYENGNLKVEGLYVNGKQKGVWNGYYSNGNPQEKFYYQNGEINGIAEFWNADSTPNYEEKYNMGDFIARYYYNVGGDEITSIETNNGNGEINLQIPNSEYQQKGKMQYGVLNGNSREYLGNNLVSDLNYDNGEMHGIQNYYFSNSQLMSSGEVVYGERNGVWKYYYPAGTLKNKSAFNLEKLTDTVFSYYPSGALRMLNVYVEGKLDGVSIWYYENGSVKKITSCSNGEREGWTIDYEPEGRILMERFYHTGVAIIIKGLASNGKDTVVVVPKLNSNDTLNFYYDNGQLAYCARLNNGLFEGAIVKYYYNGQMMEHSQYKHDQPVGLEEEYYSSGKLYSQNNYKDGVLHGQKTEYFENGQISEQENYYLGNSHGDYKAYNKTGTLLVYAEYNHGTLVKNKWRK